MTRNLSGDNIGFWRSARGLGFSLLERLAVVEVCVDEDAHETPRERGEVALGGLGDREAGGGQVCRM
jgi:hypothetical protein